MHAATAMSTSSSSSHPRSMPVKRPGRCSTCWGASPSPPTLSSPHRRSSTTMGRYPAWCITRRSRKDASSMSSERAPFVRMANTWLRDGLQELTAARHALANPSLWPRRLVAFHAQQATEKVLKAALVYARIEFGPTHSLNLLVQSLPDDGTWSTRAKYMDL